jgi:hypothetical protein
VVEVLARDMVLIQDKGHLLALVLRKVEVFLQEREHLLALELQQAELLDTVVELLHKLELVLHMDDLLEQVQAVAQELHMDTLPDKVQAVEQVQHMDDRLVSVLDEEQGHHKVLVRSQVELYVEQVRQQVALCFGNKAEAQEKDKDKAVGQVHHMDTSLVVNMEIRHQTS